MPITGKFEADFTAFSSAVEGAIAQLEAFGKEVTTLKGQIAKLGEGDNLDAVKQSTDAAAAGLRELKTLALSVGQAFGIAFSVSAIVNFVSGLLDAAKALRNLSTETGISTTQLQLMAGAFGDLGVSMDDIGRAAANLQNRIGGREGSAVAALHALGITADELRGKNIDEVFRRIFERLDKMPDTMRQIAVAGDLFGTKMAGAALKMAHDYDAAIAKQKELNNAMSPDAVDAAAKASEAVGQMASNVKTLATEGIAPLASEFNELYRTWAEAPSKWAALKTILADAYAMMKGFASPELMAAMRDGMRVPTSTDINLPAPGQAAGAAPGVSDAMKAIIADYTKQMAALTDEEKRALDVLWDMQAATDANVKSITLQTDAAKAYLKTLDEQYQQQIAASQNQEQLRELQKDLFARVMAEQDKLNAKVQKEVDARAAIVDSLRTQAILEAEQAKKINMERALGPGQDQPVTAAMDTLNEAIKRVAEREAQTLQWEGELRLRLQQDYDAWYQKFLTGAKGGFTPQMPDIVTAPRPQPIQPYVPVTVYVQGVWDPSTISELTDQISIEIIKRTASGRQLPNQ